MDWNDRIEDDENGAHFKEKCESVGGKCGIDDGIYTCRIDNRNCDMTVIEEDGYYIVLKYEIEGESPPSLVDAVVSLKKNRLSSDYIIIEGNTEFSGGSEAAKIEIPERNVRMKKRNGHKVKSGSLTEYEQ